MPVLNVLKSESFTFKRQLNIKAKKKKKKEKKSGACQNYKYTVGKELKYKLEAKNKYSSHAIVDALKSHVITNFLDRKSIKKLLERK